MRNERKRRREFRRGKIKEKRKWRRRTLRSEERGGHQERTDIVRTLTDDIDRYHMNIKNYSIVIKYHMNSYNYLFKFIVIGDTGTLSG